MEILSYICVMKKLSNILKAIAELNIYCWGGIPTAILIGSFVGVPFGFVISWGATFLFYFISSKINAV